MMLILFATILSVLFTDCSKTSDPAAAANTGTTITGPGATWTSVTTPSGNSNWRGVAYGNNIWVTVGNGYRATSVNGSSWTSAAVTNSYYFQTSVAFANGIFIAASQLGVSTSTNGSSWTNQLLGPAQNLSGLTYGNGTWVILNDRFLNNDFLAFMISTTNGAGWQQVLTGIPYAQPTSIVFGNGKFVAVGYGGLVATSTNGTTWTQENLGSTSDVGLIAVTYNNNKFVAVTNSGKAYSSVDGTTWTKVGVTVNALYGVSFGNGVFVAVGAAGSIYTSPDALTWTRRTWTGPNTDFEDVAFGNSRFVAVGSYSFALSQ